VYLVHLVDLKYLRHGRLLAGHLQGLDVQTHGTVGAEDGLYDTTQAKSYQIWQKRQACSTNYWIIQLSHKE